jgi:GT2 family glycosyltransferase
VSAGSLPNQPSRSEPGDLAQAATAVIVVNWNRRELLKTSIASLKRQSLPFARIVVVDNASRDGSAEWVASQPGIELIEMTSNRGFAGGCNQAIRRLLDESDIDCIAVVNNDVRLDPDWHRQALSALQAEPGYGSCASCLLRAAAPDRIDTAGIVWRSAGHADNFLPGRPASELTASPQAIFGASAAAALYRRELFEQVGLFEPSFFAYQEDVDLALRARLQGWRAVLAPQARGTHLGFGSNRRFPFGGTWADFYNARNRLLVLARCLPPGTWKSQRRAIAGMGWRWIADGFRQRRGLAVLAGTLHGLLRLPGAIRSRARLFAGISETDWSRRYAEACQ